MTEKTTHKDLPKDNGTDAPASDPKTQAKLEAANEKGKDFGDWKYKPWMGKDHWVHEKTGASTFNLKQVE